MTCAVIKRIYYAFELELDSPLSISSGRDDFTDSDLLRDGKGMPFIPGSSVAGAFRAYLGLQKNQAGILGFLKEKDGRMSSIFISDMFFSGKTVVSARDGIRLGEDKIAIKGGKFEREIVETGAKTTMYISCQVREGESCKEFETAVKTLLLAVVQGEIRFGGRKNRGYGKMHVCSVHEAEFDASSVEKWLEFEEDPRNTASYQKHCTLNEWTTGEEPLSGKYIFLEIPLRLKGGISIRKYSTRPGDADYEHLTCNEKAVIPGSSWNGLIRSAAGQILRELGCKNWEDWLSNWFGFVDVDNQKAKQSLVVIEESILEGGSMLPMTRNQVDRFDASTKSGALYTELSYMGGTTTLCIGIHKDREMKYLSLIGLLLLVIKDIEEGYVAVGGQTAVGRGIFVGEGSIHFSEAVEEQACKAAFYRCMREEVQP